MGCRATVLLVDLVVVYVMGFSTGAWWVTLCGSVKSNWAILNGGSCGVLNEIKESSRGWV